MSVVQYPVRGLTKNCVVADEFSPFLTLPVEFAVDASVYSVATNSQGNAIAFGSPEKVVGIYDPRTARRVARL